MASKDKRENGSAMDDAEFEKLLDEMDELGRQADVLREKVNHLIDEMRENDVVVDEEAGGEGNEESETGEKAVDEEAGVYGNPESGIGDDGEQKAVDDSGNQHPEEPPTAGSAQ